MQLDGIKVAHFLAALHEVCEGDIIHDLVNGIIELLPHRQGNTGLRLWTALHAFFHTGDRRQRAFCQAQNIANRVFLRRPCQTIAAGRAAHALDEARLCQNTNDLSEIQSLRLAESAHTP